MDLNKWFVSFITTPMVLTFICTLPARGSKKAGKKKIKFSEKNKKKGCGKCEASALKPFLISCVRQSRMLLIFCRPSGRIAHNPDSRPKALGPDKVTFVPVYWWWPRWRGITILLPPGGAHWLVGSSKGKWNASHLRVCVCECELSNWKPTLAITNWTLIK